MYSSIAAKPDGHECPVTGSPVSSHIAAMLPVTGHSRVLSQPDVKPYVCIDILMRQNKYLNNVVEQDHRGVKRVTQPMLGFKSFWRARITIAGIETMHMIKRGQLDCLLDQPCPHQISSMARPSEQMRANALLWDDPPLLHQNPNNQLTLKVPELLT
jgi:hypothetical protein